MYGLLAPDATSTFIRASYTNEELLDSELLHCIKAPTTETPFQFCSVKWHVLGLTKITSNRDFVFVEASGTVDSSNNERVGYHIMHSVDLPGLGELSEQYQVRRGRMVSCHLFRQLPNGSVDVYMKGSVDPGGHMPESVAIASTASALLKLGQAVECSHSKKLEYLLEQQQIKRSSAMRRTSGSSHVSSRSSAQSDRSIGPIKLIQSNKSSKSCAICSATLHLFRSVASCELCTHAVCSRCRVTRRLSYRVARPKELKEKNTIANFNENAVKDSFHSGKARNFLSSSTVSSNNVALSSNCTRLETPVEEDEEESASSRRRSLSFDVSDVRVRRRSTTHPPTAAESKLAELDLSVSLSVVSCSSDYLDEDFYEGEAGQRKTQPPNVFSEIPELPETTNPLTSSLPPKPSVPPMNSQLRQRRELMRRMTELRKNAESAFQITQRNTEMMQCGGMPLKAQSVCISTVEVGMDLD
ncbi:hypothetical protein BBO99_00005856 [Phytophthora kernoviae]|uniref:FYVE-type domain-containing protein n=1 Tax=Phytophthora kernoviae TaxID=325452 RepID=A0A3R7MSC3_9STRA|nr:hypothetical protein JM16_006103 [Phytophthora kernoviae]RLN31429.1 hypothetical protein BBI17_006376 [Phytophthora kernoviae]RLN78603.1 hypothetical protein BBO99_00005856 [Phytophthora kernoviae]